MSPLDAIGYGVLVVVVTLGFATIAWEGRQLHHRRRPPPPEPPFPRPPADSYGVTMDPRWRPTPVNQPPTHTATCHCPGCTHR